MVVPDERRPYGPLLRLSALGLTMGLCIAIGAGAGLWLDHRLSSEPAALVVGFFLGTAAAFVQLLRATREM